MSKVLVIDDDEGLRRICARALGERGHDVVLAADGQAALRALGGGGFDAVISDIVMPGLDGISLLRQIRERDLDLPVLLMTGNPALGTVQSALRYGALGYLQKPFELGALQEEVARAVRLCALARAKRAALGLLHPDLARAGDHAGLEISFARALKAAWMAYQPIVDPARRAIFGFEALARTRDEDIPHIGALLDAAERLGAQAELGRTLRALAATGAALPGEALLFVNLHATDLEDETLYAPDGALGRIAGRVVLEITERAAIDRIDGLASRLARLRGMGYRIAVDDIGAGYAGLASFASLKPDIAKLDMELLRGVDADPVRQRLVRTIAGVCRDLGVRVVGEGIETAAERDCAIELGCELLQGYLFARPAAPPPGVSW